MNAILSAFVFVFTSLSRMEYLVCSCSFIRCDFVSLIFFFVSFLSSTVLNWSVFIHSSFRVFCTLGVTCLFRLKLSMFISCSSCSTWKLSRFSEIPTHFVFGSCSIFLSGLPNYPDEQIQNVSFLLQIVLQLKLFS